MLGYLAYDITEMKVGCVLLQATLGGSSKMAQQFDTEHWLLAPTPDLHVYPIRDEQQLAELIAKTEAAHAKV